MYLHEDIVAALSDSKEFAQAVAKNLDDSTAWADADTDVVDGALSDVIRAVLEAL